jgi:hypothetical protein
MGAQAASRARKGGIIYDHTKPYRHMPNEAEEGIQQAAGRRHAHPRRRHAQHAHAGHGRRRGLQPDPQGRRQVGAAGAPGVVSLTPSVSRINLTARPTAPSRSAAWPALYINKAEADRLAGLYAVSDLGRRREIVAGINEQLFHASGCPGPRTAWSS